MATVQTYIMMFGICFWSLGAKRWWEQLVRSAIRTKNSALTLSLTVNRLENLSLGTQKKTQKQEKKIIYLWGERGLLPT